MHSTENKCCFCRRKREFDCGSESFIERQTDLELRLALQNQSDVFSAQSIAEMVLEDGSIHGISVSLSRLITAIIEDKEDLSSEIKELKSDILETLYCSWSPERRFRDYWNRLCASHDDDSD